MPTLILSPWEWFADLDDDEGYWRAPGGTAIGTINLKPQGIALFTYPDGATLPSDALNLGADLERFLTTREVDSLKTLANITVRTTDTVVGAIYNTLLDPVNYDPTGVLRNKPLRTSRRAGLKCYLTGFGVDGLIINEQFSPSSPAFTSTIAVHWVDYRREREYAETLSQVEREEYLQSIEKWTGATMLKLFGRKGDDLLDVVVPPEYLNGDKGRDGWRFPETTYTDEFTDTNGTSLDAHTPDPTDWGSWTEVIGTELLISSNRARAENAPTGGRARADADLSDDDMDVTVDRVAHDDAARNAFAIARFKSDADTSYFAANRATATTTHRLFEVTAGSNTQLGSTVDESVTIPYTIGVRTDGSSISALLDGVVKVGPITDTTHTGFKRGGLGITGIAAAGRYVELDSWKAQDLIDIRKQITAAYMRING